MAVGRDTLITAITTFLADHDPRTLSAIREALEREIDGAGPEALAPAQRTPRRQRRRLALLPGRSARPADSPRPGRQPAAPRVGVCTASSTPPPCLRQPVVIFANHLSYSDANLLEILLQRFGGAPLADRLTVIAGPKVYSSMKRRFSSLCFGTIKTPQSSALSTEDAVMNAREVARAARLSIDIAHERLGVGDALLVFGEGTRSRSSGMQHAAARRLAVSRGSRDVGAARGNRRNRGTISRGRRRAALGADRDPPGPAVPRSACCTSGRTATGG